MASPSLPTRLLRDYAQLCAKIVIAGRRPLIIGITGSAGKTTTKEMIASILEQDSARAYVGSVFKTPGNMNDDSGVPMTIMVYGDYSTVGLVKRLLKYAALPFRAVRLALSPSYPKVLILEFGTHWDGHLHRLANVAPPRIGIVTTIGAAHLDRLGSIEGVVKEKSAIVAAVPADGRVILGGNHNYVDALRTAARAPVVVIEGDGLELDRNIAREAARTVGVPPELIETGLAKFRQPEGRLCVHDLRQFRLIDDSYNANPTSMRHGLEVMKTTAKPHERKVVFLGFMAELGDAAHEYHREVGEHARQHADVVVGVGEAARLYQPHRWFSSSDECAAELPNLIRQGDLVFVKGSNASAMKKVVEAALAMPQLNG